MRITTRYDLKNMQIRKDLIMKSIIEDIEHLAEARFEDEFQAFFIDIRLRPIKRYEEGYR